MGLFIEHLLGIAMVGGDEHHAARRLDRLHQASQAGVDGFDGLGRRGEIAGVADHVGIGEVDHDQVEFARADRLDELVGHFRSAHLGLEVVGLDLGGGDQDALLAVEHALLAAVEEEGDVRVLLGLGDAQLLEAGARHRLAQPHLDDFRREQRAQQRIEGRRIVDHADCRRELHHARAVEAVEPRIEQRRQDLARPVGAEIEHQEAVAVLHAGIAVDHGRQHELVVELGGISLLDGGDRRGGVLVGLGVDDRVIGQRYALPALVAIHRIEAAGHGGEPDRQAGLERRLHGLEAILQGTARRHVPAVEEGMDPDRHAVAGDQVGEEDEMILVRVHAARREETQQVAGGAALLQGGDRLGEHRMPGQRAILDGVVDARQVGHRDAAGAEIHVADLGIAHLALGQADERLGCIDQALRAGRDQAVEARCLGVQDGVVGTVGAIAPAVEDAEQGGTRTGHDSHYEAFLWRGRSRSTALNLLGQLRSRGSVLGFWSGTSMAQNTNSPRGSPSIVMS